MLDRYLRKELPEQLRESVQDHLNDCATCRQDLAFHRTLDARLSSATELPEGFADLVKYRIAVAPPKTSWLARTFGDPIMRNILISSTAATVVIAAALTFSAGKASASTPLEKFKGLRSALANSARSGEVKIQIAADKDGVLTLTGTLDGESLPPGFPVFVEASVHGNIVDATVIIDLSVSSYSSIQFGHDHNTLEMTPKQHPDQRIRIGLDPKSLKPKSWTSLHRDGNGWKVQSHHDYIPKATGAPSKDEPKPIRLGIRLLTGTTASVGISPS